MAYFVEHLTEEAITLQKLLLPAEFVSNCGRVNLTNPVVLEPTVGDPLEVELYEDTRGFWLKNGWQEVVDRYSLNHGHYLYFEFKSYSRLKFVMLSEFPAPSVVEVASNGNQEFPEAEEEEKTVDTDSLVSLGTADLQAPSRSRGSRRPFGIDKAGNPHIPSMEGEPVAKRPFSCHNDELNENQDVTESAKGEEIDADYVEFLGLTFLKEMNIDNGGGARQSPQLQSAENSKQKEFMSARKRRRANGGANRKVNQEAPRTYRGHGSPFRMENAETSHIPSMAEQEESRGNASTSSFIPSFFLTIKECHFRRRKFYVPADFVFGHMKLENYSMMVCGKDGSGPWSFPFLFTPAHKCLRGRGQGSFCGVCPAFLIDNSLKPGDVCQFKLMSDNEMEVTIQRS